ncbi:hypothetical protein ABIE58_004125, partial [Roseovarius sp. MBR-78]|uniref:hypothetical protein n=1 Tax=Roseovarius sp. MBR-78 TaxID=3156460 RepID=UPI003396E93C
KPICAIVAPHPVLSLRSYRNAGVSAIFRGALKSANRNPITLPDDYVLTTPRGVLIAAAKIIIIGVALAPRVKRLSYDFPWLQGQKGATARHAIYGGQWLRLDRKQLGLPGPLRSMINRRLHHRA